MKALVEGMPGSGECENYVFMAMQPGRGSGAFPMFKKDAADSVAAAERAEEKMRGELEKAWWNGVPETAKVGIGGGVGSGNVPTRPDPCICPDP